MNKKNEQLLASFYSSPMFRAFGEMIDERIEDLMGIFAKKDNEFETIYNLGVLEGRRKELHELKRRLEDIYRKFKNEENRG